MKRLASGVLVSGVLVLTRAVVVWAGEAEVIARLTKLGGIIKQDESQPGKPVVEVDLRGTRVTDVGLKELAGLKNLHTLDLRKTRVTGAGLKELAGLNNLHTLHLSYTGVADAGLKQLASLKNLHTLDLT